MGKEIRIRGASIENVFEVSVRGVKMRVIG